MTISLERKLAELSPARREKVEARAQHLIAEELTLREASSLIDELKSTPTGGRNGGGR